MVEGQLLGLKFRVQGVSERSSSEVPKMCSGVIVKSSRHAKETRA